MYQFVPGIRKLNSLILYLVRSSTNIYTVVGVVIGVVAAVSQYKQWSSSSSSGVPVQLVQQQQQYHTVSVVVLVQQQWYQILTVTVVVGVLTVYSQQQQCKHCQVCTAENRIEGIHIYIYTRFPSGKRLGEWRKNETKSIQRETNTTTPEIEE